MELHPELPPWFHLFPCYQVLWAPPWLVSVSWRLPPLLGLLLIPYHYLHHLNHHTSQPQRQTGGYQVAPAVLKHLQLQNQLSAAQVLLRVHSLDLLFNTSLQFLPLSLREALFTCQTRTSLRMA